MSAVMLDVLGQVLDETRLRGRVYCETLARAPWGVSFEAGDPPVFHLVTAGRCQLLVSGATLELVAGDIVLVAPHTAHALADDVRSARVRLADWLAERDARAPRLGGDGPETRVLCGVYEFERAGPNHPVLRLLPRTLFLPAARQRERADLAATLAALQREYGSGARGASLVVTRLLEILFVQVVRAWADDQPPGGAGWIGALRDPALARALALLHEDLGRDWTVDALARIAGTSRATLGRRFLAEVGESPLAYLTRARMQLAARRLETTDDGLAAIAQELGYTSEFAFNKAFRRTLGVPPGLYRKQYLSASVEARDTPRSR